MSKILKSGVVRKKKEGKGIAYVVLVVVVVVVVVVVYSLLYKTKGWKSRYCVLTETHFVYFENKDAKDNNKPQGIMWLLLLMYLLL